MKSGDITCMFKPRAKSGKNKTKSQETPTNWTN